MRLKKVISAILVIAILAGYFSWVSFIKPMVVNAETKQTREASTNVADKYFYRQLGDDEKVFYDIFDEMFYHCDYDELTKELEREGTKFGVDSKDITDKINESDSLKAKLQAYTKGNQGLLNTMGAAKDAYFADHAGLFFVDPDYVTLRVLSQAGQLKVLLGIGRSETYINKAFWDYTEKKVKVEDLKNALKTVKDNLAEAVEQVNSVTAGENQDLVEQKIKKAHDLVIEANKYKLEETIIEENQHLEDGQKGDPWNVRTVYGAFGPKHEIVCEGFARAFKMILDEVDIPCVLVYGAYTSSTRYEEHMWNYVQYNNKWYAVDTTWDNTDKEDTDLAADLHKEKISQQYLLAGKDVMDLNHTVTGIMSVSNFEFKYPELEKSSDKYELASEHAGLRVELDDESYDDEDDIRAAKLKISYFIDLNENGIEDPGERMGYKKAKEHGYYFVCSMMQYKVPNYNFHATPLNPDEEGWQYSKYFAYVIDLYDSLKDFYEDDGSEVTDNDGINDRDSYLSFYNSNCNYLQFGVTTEQPLEYYPEIKPEEIRKMTTYFGTSSDMVALSDKIYNPAGEYVKPPYIKTASPVQNSTMLIEDGPYEVTLVYDEKLVQIPGEEIEPKVTIDNSSNTQDNKYELTEFEFDGDKTITFKFKPSELYADDSVYYIIDILGLMGEDSHKRPMAASYFCAHKCTAYAFKSQGFDWNVYGKPQLMDDANLDALAKGVDGMTDEENSDLAELLKHRMTLVTETTKPQETKEMNDLLETRDDLTGGGEVVETQTYNIKLTLCKMQKIKDGQKVRIMLGFPDGYGPEDAGVTFKAYHYTKDASGRIIGVDEIPCMVTELGLIIECDAFSPFTIAAIKGATVEDTSKTVIFQSSQGGDIYIEDKIADSVKFDSQATEEAKTEITITVKPIDGYVVDDIVIGEKVIDVNGDDVAKVKSAGDLNEISYTIRYDDLKEQSGSAIVAKVAFIPEEIKKAEEDAGMKLVAQPLVQPTFKLEAEVKKGGEVLSGKLDEGDEFEVSYKITDMKSVGKQGIKGIGALLSYNREKLVCEEVKPGEGWKVDYNSSDKEEKHNIIATYKIESGAMASLTDISDDDGNQEQINQVAFTAKFMVLENETATEEIRLSHIEGGTGIKDIADVKAEDVVTKIEIEKLEEPPIEEKLEAIEGSHITVTETEVTGVHVGETVESMKTKLSSGSKLPVQFFAKQEGTEDLKELSNEDKIGTGTIVEVGERKWTIIVVADLDGNGELTINDISLFKLDYIGEIHLEEIYLKAAEMDGNTKPDGSTSINDLVLMIYEYNSVVRK